MPYLINHFTSIDQVLPAMKLLLVLYCLMLHTASFVSLIMPSSGLGRNKTDHLALLEFKSRITQDPLKVMSSWNNSMHFCHWQGITCSPKHMRVTALDLHSQNLAGSLPPHLGNLSFLHVLDLHQNNFIHQIPQELGQLFRLKKLGLENNSFDGHIPANLSRCLNLVYLGLGGNHLSGEIPAEISYLKNLQVLMLYNNFLSGSIPPSLGNLSSLEALSATINYLEGSEPDTIGHLKRLSYFTLGQNKLSGTIPSSIYNLSSITLFSVPINQIHGTLPPNLGFTIFPNLEKLNIHTNQFTGKIPKSLANASNLLAIQMSSNYFVGEVPSFARLHNLVGLSLSENNLGNGQEGDDLGFLSSLSNCTSLQFISVMENNFGGLLPTILGNLSSELRILGLGGNKIRGSIPSEIGGLVNLMALGLEDNQLTGTIPSSMGQMHKLGDFNLNNNNLSGTIPSSLGNLTSVLRFNLMVNNLEGAIPSSLGNCQNVVRLRLSWNNLNGTIPEQLVGIKSLAILLDLSHNHLTGPLPSQVGNLVELSSLDLSHNLLSGNIPDTLGSCSSLRSLHMDNNLFQGTILQSLSSLRGLDDLDLSANNLSGPIPKYLEGFIFLQNLNLSYNDFEGEVPRVGVFKNATGFSITGNRRLCGGMHELHLPICTDQETKKQKRRVGAVAVICIVAGIVGLSLALLAFVFYMSSRKKRRQHVSSASSLDGFFMRLSYEALLTATNGFSSANLIGQGSFGSVYKATLEESETIVAVKVLDPQLRGAFKSFMAECQALRSAKHRNLLKILTACSSVDFQNNEFLALVYEYMPNGCLEEWLHPSEEPKWLSLERRLDIAIDIACALSYLHHGNQIPIVHCDLKPSNVLMDHDMTAHVGDFGLARLLIQTSSSNQSSNTIGLKGSIGYVAPEYGMGREASTSGDVYSFGILLLEMFTGKRPTHDMFKDGLNLREFASSGEVTQVVDPKLLIPVDDGQNKDRVTCNKTRECLVSVLSVGIACSAETPGQRMGIDTVLTQLHQIRTTLFRTQ